LKTNLENQFGAMGLSLPTVISAEKYIARRPPIGDRFTLSFGCDKDGAREAFSIEMCLIREKTSNSYLKELAELHSKLL
jgi:hypothetical protein